MSLRKRLLTAALASALLSGPALARDLEIGGIHATSGPVGFVGVTIVNGAQLAVDELNAAGYFGEDRLVFNQEDTASDKNQALTLLSKMAADRDILFVFGPTSSVESLAVAPVANEREILMFTTAISPEIFPAGPWGIKGTVNPDHEILPLAKFAVGDLGVKRLAVVYDRQNDSTVKQKNVVVEYMKSQGVEVTSENGVLGSDSDFSAIATKIADEAPDAVFISTQAPVGANVMIQLKQAGLDPDTHILGSVNLAVAHLLKLAGPAAEGAYLVGDFVPGGMNDQGRAFAAAYEKRFGIPPDNYAAVGYTMMYAAAQALKAAGPGYERAAIRDALRQTKDMPAVIGTGTYTITQDREVLYDGALLVVKDGKFVAAKPD